MISITAGKGSSNLDAMCWKEESAVALGEMMYDLGQVLDEKFKMEKQTANALLMGIIDQTERYKSRRTRPETMHTSGELLELGADLALLAENLALASTVPADIPEAAIQEETKEMVEDAVGEAGKYDTQLIKDKDKKKAGRSQRLYIRQGGGDEALSYSKGGKLKEEDIKEEHQLDKLNIDAEGNLHILSEDDEEELRDEKTAPAATSSPAPAAVSAASASAPPVGSSKPIAPALAASPVAAPAIANGMQAKPSISPGRSGNTLAPLGNIQAPHPATGASSPPTHPITGAAPAAATPPPHLAVSATALALAQAANPGMDNKAPSINEIVDKNAIAPAPVAQAPPLATANKADSMNQYIDSLSSAADSATQSSAAPTVNNYLTQQSPPPAAIQAPPLVAPQQQAASPGNPTMPPTAPPLPSVG